MTTRYFRPDPDKICIVHGEPGERESQTNRIVTWQEFHTVRNAVLAVCRNYGTVGPMGVARITQDEDGPPNPWGVESDAPDFFVVDDQWNSHQTYIRVELDPSKIVSGLLPDLSTMLCQRPEWGVDLAVTCGLIHARHDKIMISGPGFGQCSSLADVEMASQEAAVLLKIAEKDKAQRQARRRDKVRALLVEAYRKVKEEALCFHLVAAFRTTAEDHPGVSIWLMFGKIRGNDEADAKIKSEPSWVRPSSFWVTSDGAMRENTLEWPEGVDSPALLLAEYELQTDEGEPRTDASTLVLHMGKDAWRFELTFQPS